MVSFPSIVAVKCHFTRMCNHLIVKLVADCSLRMGLRTNDINEAYLGTMQHYVNLTAEMQVSSYQS